MWVQIALSLVLAVVAIRVIMYSAQHDVVPVIDGSQDFIVRMPRTFVLIGIVLFLVAGSFTLSMIVWSTVSFFAIAGTAAVGVVGLWFVLRGVVWRIEVRKKYLIFVSMFGIKRLVHFSDIEGAHVDKSGVSITTPLKSFKISRHAVYVENFLQRLADEHVPVYRD